MEAKELMIGDWVLIGNNHIRVTSLQEGKDYVEAQPIPLTAEILEKNGFEKSNQISDTPPYYMDEEGNIYYSFEQNGVNHFWGWWQPDNVFEIPTNAMGWINIKYVHELQHALRLCGIDKEIVL